MALKDLSTRTMVKLGADLLQEDGEQRKALEKIPKTAALLPDLERAQAGVIAAQPPSKAELDKITQRLRRGDGRHDELVRCIDDRMLSELAATKNPDIRELISEIRMAVLPTGRAIINRTFLDESGEGKLRAARVTEEHRKVLRKLKTVEGVTFEELYDELQATAAEIGALEKERSDRGAAQDRLVKNREARNQWIRVVNGIASMLELERVDEGPILGNVREEEAKAALHVGAADEEDGDADEDDFTDGSDTDGTDTDGTDTDESDVLDPPVPTDGEEPTDPTS